MKLFIKTAIVTFSLKNVFFFISSYVQIYHVQHTMHVNDISKIIECNCCVEIGHHKLWCPLIMYGFCSFLLLSVDMGRVIVFHSINLPDKETFVMSCTLLDVMKMA